MKIHIDTPLLIIAAISIFIGTVVGYQTDAVAGIIPRLIGRGK